MADDLVQRVIDSVQAVVAKAVTDLELRINERLLVQGNDLLALLTRIDALPKAEKGDTGELGPPGRDAEPINFDEIKKTLAEMFATIPPPRDGVDGKDGVSPEPAAIVESLRSEMDKEIALAFAAVPVPKNGVDGLHGKDGKDGTSPEPAAIVELIRPEIEKEIALGIASMPAPKNGTDGQDGQDGKDGERGEAGRDALDVDIMKGVSEDRSYARGTWASFYGSLWVATRQTIPLADKSAEHGWRCIVAGVSAMQCHFDVDLRLLKFEWKQGGVGCMQAVEVPVLIDRGVYRIEREYHAGDVVSEDGSAWAARELTSERPGTSKAWRLLVMRGRNGKDAERAARIDGPVHLR